MSCTHSIVLGSGRCYFCNELAGPTCEYPGCVNIGRPVPSQTMYEWNGIGEDPNRDLVLCGPCGYEYTENMNHQWAVYYGGLL